MSPKACVLPEGRSPKACPGQEGPPRVCVPEGRPEGRPATEGRPKVPDQLQCEPECLGRRPDANSEFFFRVHVRANVEHGVLLVITSDR